MRDLRDVNEGGTRWEVVEGVGVGGMFWGGLDGVGGGTCG